MSLLTGIIRFAAASLSLMTVSLACTAEDAAVDSLVYAVRYHLGFIKVDAGVLTVGTAITPGAITATLNGHSIPIGGNVFAVSDTLSADFDGLNCRHINRAVGWYSRFNPSDASAVPFSNPALFRTTGGYGLLDASADTMEAVGISTALLAVYYILPRLDFGNMSPGDTFSFVLPAAGGLPHKLEIACQGRGSCDGSPSNIVTFTFSGDGINRLYPITAHVDCETAVPRMLCADIKIGHIELALQQDDRAN